MSFLSIVFCAETFSQTTDIIKGIKNQVYLVKGSHAMPTLKCKEGITIMMQNEETGMDFTVVKNGKQFPLFASVSSATYGQLAETDVDGDGKMEIMGGYRSGPDNFIINIFKKPEYELDYKLWATVSGQSYCEFPGNSIAKVYAKNGTVKTVTIDTEGKISDK